MCDLPLPLRIPEIDEQGCSWECVGCGSTFYGLLVKEGPALTLRRNVRLVMTDADAVNGLWATAYGPKGRSSSALPANPRTLCPVQTPLSRVLDEAIDRGIALRAREQGPSFSQQMRNREPNSYESRTVRRFVKNVETSFDCIEELFSSLHRQNLPRLEAIEPVTAAALADAAEDLDLFVSLGINPPDDSYPSRHGLHVAMLAMSIGADMGWDERTLIDLGIGCMIHDAGMLAVSNAPFALNRVLDPDEMREIVKHPLHTFELLEKQLDKVPARSRMVAYQTHERCNGDGYPRGRRSPQIHPLAKISAVADVFVALVSPRPHRPGMIPYYAIEHLLYGAQEGAFDPAVVRALLHTVSLFPLGSRVSLSDGRVGTVIRTNGRRYDRPIVEVPSAPHSHPSNAIVDLAKQTHLSIHRPLAA
jgi:HD-GYP domain-containing protein (c-di-GMP phosphodiesterase class II)